MLKNEIRKKSWQREVGAKCVSGVQQNVRRSPSFWLPPQHALFQIARLCPSPLSVSTGITTTRCWFGSIRWINNSFLNILGVVVYERKLMSHDNVDKWFNWPGEEDYLILDLINYIKALWYIRSSNHCQIWPFLRGLALGPWFVWKCDEN